jgi:hypothetical protein
MAVKIEYMSREFENIFAICKDPTSSATPTIHSYSSLRYIYVTNDINDK